MRSTERLPLLPSPSARQPLQDRAPAIILHVRLLPFAVIPLIVAEAVLVSIALLLFAGRAPSAPSPEMPMPVSVEPPVALPLPAVVVPVPPPIVLPTPPPPIVAAASVGEPAINERP